MDPWLESLGADPLAALAAWLEEARGACLYEPEAAALATAAPDGRPAVRMVLVRGIGERDLRFYTNHESRKAEELAANPRAALVFHWASPLHRQARIEGPVARLTDEESLSYFRTRERDSRLGAWASPQSRPLADRDELDRRLADVEQRFTEDGDIALPPFWGGYRMTAEAIELWQSRSGRLHDRARYDRAGETWWRVRLAP